jgi:hypothetical protein
VPTQLQIHHQYIPEAAKCQPDSCLGEHLGFPISSYNPFPFRNPNPGSSLDRKPDIQNFIPRQEIQTRGVQPGYPSSYKLIKIPSPMSLTKRGVPKRGYRYRLCTSVLIDKLRREKNFAAARISFHQYISIKSSRNDRRTHEIMIHLSNRVIVRQKRNRT